MTLGRELKLNDADALYAAIVAAHRGLSAEASAALDARLVLLLANHIGDSDVVREALDRAMASARPSAGAPRS